MKETPKHSFRCEGRWIALLTAMLLSACSSIGPVTGVSPSQESEEALKEALGSAQSPVQDRSPAAPPPNLLPAISLDQLGSVSDERFDVSVSGISARAFFMGLAEGTEYNMLVHEEISGQITLTLKSVTVPEVMAAVRDVYGYEYRRIGNLYQVIPTEVETNIYQVNYLDIRREGRSETQVSAGSVSDSDSSSGSSDSDGGSSGNLVGTRISTSSDTDFWGQLQATLSAIIGSDAGQKVVVTPQAGVVVVRAFPSEQDTVRDYLERAELMLRRQVVIEAKILEVELNNGFQAGIDWQAVGQPSDGNTVVFSQTGGPVAAANGLNGVFSAAFNLTDFTALIDLLGSQGDVQVLSSPRVSTINNQKAVIKVGSDEFFVTDVSNTVTTGTSTTSSPDIDLTPFFSGIALDVTPQISPDGEIILHIHPTVSEVQDQQKQINVGGDSYNIPLALSSIRESDTVVRAESGQVIVIGGLMKSSSSDNFSKTPGLGDIPGLGKLFQQRNQSSSKSELVILLKPVVVDNNGWQAELQRSLESFQGLKTPPPTEEDRGQ